MKQQEHHWQVVRRGGIVVSNTPEELWENACAYFEWCDSNPIQTSNNVKVGKAAGQDLNNKYIRPYTIKGLCLHCGIMEEYLADIRATKDQESMYFHVVSKILYLIYIQNYELACVGVYSPIFASKFISSEDERKPSSTIRVEVVPGLPMLATSEEEILQKLENEIEKQKNSENENL